MVSFSVFAELRTGSAWLDTEKLKNEGLIERSYGDIDTLWCTSPYL